MRQHRLYRKLPELLRIERLAEKMSGYAEVEKIATLNMEGIRFPFYEFRMGNWKDPDVPYFGLVAGVHGLERIGTQVLTHLLETLTTRLHWDEHLRDKISRMKIQVLPMINPTGMYLNQRSNSNGVDLMRNAPVEAEEEVSFLVGGHRISEKLPWYRGESEMEFESQLLVDRVSKEVDTSPFALTIDFHSGFGIQDRLWFPYAKTKKPFDDFVNAWKFKELFRSSHKNHFYLVEPQAKNYVTHGDLWDHIYDQTKLLHPDKIFLPMTLEMGSWSWIKKNPAQAISRLGLFHPVKEHRIKRILRRHWTLFEFCMSVSVSWQNCFTAKSENLEMAHEAINAWYHTA